MERIRKVETKIKINSYEGYVRQIIGWREFIRGIYQNYDKKLEESNFFKHKNSLTKSWYDGSTGLIPLDHSIQNAEKYGYTHHIERLMILCNVMNLCEIEPKQVYNWFMGRCLLILVIGLCHQMFMAWAYLVMAEYLVQNLYICGSSYFMKMMNFKRGPWIDIMDGLYWRFINKNRKFFQTNPRLNMMVVIFDKMKDEKEKII